MNVGSQVEHPEYGPGTVKQLVGGQAVVEFFGERRPVDVKELLVTAEFEPTVPNLKGKDSPDQVEFRRAYEAINLGIVPPNPAALINMTISGKAITNRVDGWLRKASEKGLCKVVFGDYGAGKSHYLHVVRAVALQAGWVVSFVEFDPKAADPAKPHLVYREIMSKLRFPAREDGSRIDGFMGFVKEVKRNWERVREVSYLRSNPWFQKAFEVLLRYPHSEDQDYVDACGWLAGQPVDLGVIRKMASDQGMRTYRAPRMPKTRETAEIYVFHLVLIHKILNVLGYRGLLILLDEAEHVRGYNVRRKERANNFFDLLARSANPPLAGVEPPVLNDHDWQLPKYWEAGPHFGLLVGLTEGDTFADPSMPLRDACVFLHKEEDRVILRPPSPKEYEAWCARYLDKFHSYRPESTALLSTEQDRLSLAELLRDEFKSIPETDRLIRTWVKLASLVPSMLLAKKVGSFEELGAVMKRSAQEATRSVLPWERF
jgi:hypothetical protein